MNKCEYIYELVKDNDIISNNESKNIIDLSGGSTKNRYAIYLAPNINKDSHWFLKKCNPLWGGMHVTIVGFHNDHPPLKANLRKASKIIPKIFKKRKMSLWKMNPKTIKIKGNKIYFKSRSLDKLSSWFRTKGFNNVKSNWHITSENCNIPKHVSCILEDLTWSLVIVKLGNKIKWKERYALYS